MSELEDDAVVCRDVDVCGIVVVSGWLTRRRTYKQAMAQREVVDVEMEMRPAMGISRLQNNVTETMSSKML